jgi:hypothetical protein
VRGEGRHIGFLPLNQYCWWHGADRCCQLLEIGAYYSPLKPSATSGRTETGC